MFELASQHTLDQRLHITVVQAAEGQVLDVGLSAQSGEGVAKGMVPYQLSLPIGGDHEEPTGVGSRQVA